MPVQERVGRRLVLESQRCSVVGLVNRLGVKPGGTRPAPPIDASASTRANHGYCLAKFVDYCTEQGVTETSEIDGQLIEGYRTSRLSEPADSIFDVPIGERNMQSQSLPARLTPLVAVVTLPAAILTAIFISLQMALVVIVVGWLLLTPAAAILFGAPANPGLGHNLIDEEVEELVQERMKEEIREKTEQGSSGADPVEELRERYARGEIDEAELEQRLDALLEMESVESDDEESIKRAKRNIHTGKSATGSRSCDTSDSATEDDELVTDRE